MGSPARLSNEELAERAAARVAAAQELLAERVSALRSGEDWARFLEFQAKLHRYSPNNVLLIQVQHTQAHAAGLVAASEPTCVAGFGRWKALGRHVERGQHGYAVLAPVTGDRRFAVDGGGQARPLNGDETPGAGEREERRRQVRGFKVEHVFDVTQTSGAPVPDPPRPRPLHGEAPAGLGLAVKELIEARGFTVDTVADATAIGGANGQTNWASRTVVVRADMDDAAMVKTLIHEAAHLVLHEQPPGQLLARALKEIEAESVAFVVAAAHGMSTDSYSFPYVAAWAGDDPASAIQATQRRVAVAARTIIDASPACHTAGGKPPAVEPAANMDHSRRAVAIASEAVEGSAVAL